MKKQNLTLSGFSLVELMVVVAIIAIMSVSVSVGFRYMGDTLRTKQVAGIISDTVKKAEMEVLRGDYKKNTIQFTAGYLVITSEPENTSLELRLDGTDIKTSDTGVLTKRDGEGKVLGVRSFNGTPPEPVDFVPSPETEWQYQLTSGDEISPIIRFIHFNVEREKLENAVQLSNIIGGPLTIEAPYAKKTGAPITLDVSDADGNHKESLNIQ